MVGLRGSLCDLTKSLSAWRANCAHHTAAETVSNSYYGRAVDGLNARSAVGSYIEGSDRTCVRCKANLAQSAQLKDELSQLRHELEQEKSFSAKVFEERQTPEPPRASSAPRRRSRKSPPAQFRDTMGFSELSPPSPPREELLASRERFDGELAVLREQAGSQARVHSVELAGAWDKVTHLSRELERSCKQADKWKKRAAHTAQQLVLSKERAAPLERCFSRLEEMSRTRGLMEDWLQQMEGVSEGMLAKLEAGNAVGESCLAGQSLIQTQIDDMQRASPDAYEVGRSLEPPMPLPCLLLCRSDHHLPPCFQNPLSAIPFDRLGLLDELNR